MSLKLVQSDLLKRFPHGFTTRHGGVSVGPLHSLNLALRGDEHPSHLHENWSRVARSAGFDFGPERVAILNQVHGADVHVVESPAGVLKTVADADAAVTTRSDILLAVRTADCVPILFASERGIGVAHAGWRGVASEVVPKTLDALCQITGHQASDVVVVIGPHIFQDAYEVGLEVVDGIRATGVPESTFVMHRAKPHVSLGAAVRHQLERSGVRRIEQVGACTFTSTSFFSHRRDGASTGRLAGVLARPSTESRT